MKFGTTFVFLGAGVVGKSYWQHLFEGGTVRLPDHLWLFLMFQIQEIVK